MNKKEQLLKVLIEAKERKEHNLLCYSRNYVCTVAKEGYEKEFEQAKKEYHEVQTLIEYYTINL